jgi:hypothetical protein
MAGTTATIDFATLRIQWDSHSSMAAICTHWTITKDQLIASQVRGRVAAPARPPIPLQAETLRVPRSDSAQRYARRARRLPSQVGRRTREERAVIKTQNVTLRFFSVPDGCEHMLEDADE